MSEIALIGKKIGMTREFYKTGQLVPVTVLKMEKARVIHVIEQDKRRLQSRTTWIWQNKKFKTHKSHEGLFCKKKY